MSTSSISTRPEVRASPSEGGSPGTDRPVTSWSAAFRQSLLLVTATRLAVFAIAWSGTWLLTRGSNGPHVPGPVAIWNRWDTVHFVHVAQHGYSASSGLFGHDTAFFPLYPLAIRLLSVTGISPVLAGLLISYAAGVVGCAYLIRLAEDQIGAGTGLTVTLFLLLAPTAVFLTAAYSESLFLAGAIAAFYYARRAAWIASGVSAAVAMGARAAALFLLFGLAVEFLSQPGRPGRRLGGALVGLGIALLPLIVYCIYLVVVKNDAFDFLAAQKAGWYRTFVGPIRSFSATWGTWNDSQPTNWIFAWRLEILAAAAGVGFTVWAMVKRWWGYAAYMAATLIYLMTSTWYFSIPRLLLGLFPIFLLLGDWAKSPARRELLLSVMGPVAALGVIVFTQGAWFF